MGACSKLAWLRLLISIRFSDGSIGGGSVSRMIEQGFTSIGGKCASTAGGLSSAPSRGSALVTGDRCAMWQKKLFQFDRLDGVQSAFRQVCSDAKHNDVT